MINSKQRSSQMRSLFGSVDAAELAKHMPATSVAKVGSGAVKSMDRAFVAVEEENERLRQQLSGADAVVDLDPALVVPSFVQDRLDIEGDPQFASFLENIRDNGQRLPILVRPSPDRQGNFQVAYGHRRLTACRILGLPVKAMIRNLSDDELVVAQGVENAERASLSFIEQALFAAALKERGFARKTIAMALGRTENKLTYISMLIGIVERLPRDLILAIGAAPTVGRPKWEKLASYFRDGEASAFVQAMIDQLRSAATWTEATSDQRFTTLMTTLERRTPRRADVEKIDVGGGLLVTTKVSKDSTTFSIPERNLPGLSAWLLERLPGLVNDYRQKGGGAGDEVN